MQHKDFAAQLDIATKHLAANDPILAHIMPAIGPPTFTPHADYYLELVDSIISQQLSVKAARTIRQRFMDMFGGTMPSPAAILQKDVDELRTAGLSRAKATYIIDLARHITDGSLHIDRLPDLSNEEIIRELTAVKGIGEWTAHMFLMFALGRLDILPTGDLGIKNGIQKLYGLPSQPDAAHIATLSQKNNWHPYESVASWYIWQAFDNQP